MNTLPYDISRCTGDNPSKKYKCPDAVVCSRCSAHRYWDKQVGADLRQISVIQAEPDCEHRAEVVE